jgi:hypothetical protein
LGIRRLGAVFQGGIAVEQIESTVRSQTPRERNIHALLLVRGLAKDNISIQDTTLHQSRVPCAAIASLPNSVAYCIFMIKKLSSWSNVVLTTYSSLDEGVNSEES